MQTEIDRQTDRQSERDRDRETETDTQTERQTQRTYIDCTVAVQMQREGSVHFHVSYAFICYSVS